MKILNVVSVYFSIPFFFGDQIDYFVSKGYEIHLVCSPSDQIKGFSLKHGAKYKEIPILRKISIFNDIKAVYKLYKYIKNNNFDIVCGHTPKGGLIAMLASFIARTPKRVFFRHGLVYETSSGLKRIILILMERITSFCSTQVICVSPYLIERSIKDKLTPKNKMEILNLGSCNGINVEAFNPYIFHDDDREKIKQKLGIPNNSFIITYTGRLVHDKGIEELVDAFILLKKNHTNVYLLLVGPFENKDPLSERTINLIKSNKEIILTGLVNNNINKYYSITNTLVLPTYREGLGTCILEASSMEIPVLTTSHTGSRDAIIDGVTGFYIELTPEDISKKIEYLINNPKEAILLGKNGRKHMIKNFKQEYIWNEIEKKIYLS